MTVLILLLILIMLAVYWIAGIHAGIFLTTLIFGAALLLSKVILKHPPSNRLAALFVDYSKSLFPWFLLITLVRGFVIEPFHIPSDSMYPMMKKGDFLVGSKYDFGIHLPFSLHRITQGREPHRGEVVLFHYPYDPSKIYIKRVIGLPGDRITYKDKQFSINNTPVPQTLEKENETERFLKETLGGNEYTVHTLKDSPDFSVGCVNGAPASQTVVPPSHYFMVGDNRDGSRDSRCWGFVPASHLVGIPLVKWTEKLSDQDAPKASSLLSKEVASGVSPGVASVADGER